MAIAVAMAACSAAAPPADDAGSGGSAGSPQGCPTDGPKPMASNATATVTIATPKGAIVIKVEGKLGPLAAANFVALADCHYYDGVVFHRLVPGFVIQGGDGQYGRTPNVDMSRVGQGGPDYLFADDPVSVPYTRGTVAMANSGPDTNGSQFFIVLADDNGLQPLYSVFGHVTSGMDTVDAIAAMPNSGDPANAALDPVPMTTVTSTTP
jgi:cyclophilin family peptidyl-prolyl cis-trans isomerase